MPDLTLQVEWFSEGGIILSRGDGHFVLSADECRDLGIRKRKRRAEEMAALRERAQEMRRQGRKLREIGEELGIGANYVGMLTGTVRRIRNPRRKGPKGRYFWSTERLECLRSTAARCDMTNYHRISEVLREQGIECSPMGIAAAVATFAIPNHIKVGRPPKQA